MIGYRVEPRRGDMIPDLELMHRNCVAPSGALWLIASTEPMGSRPWLQHFAPSGADRAWDTFAVRQEELSVAGGWQ